MKLSRDGPNSEWAGLESDLAGVKLPRDGPNPEWAGLESELAGVKLSWVGADSRRVGPYLKREMHRSLRIAPYQELAGLEQELDGLHFEVDIESRTPPPRHFLRDSRKQQLSTGDDRRGAGVTQ